MNDVDMSLVSVPNVSATISNSSGYSIAAGRGNATNALGEVPAAGAIGFSVSEFFAFEAAGALMLTVTRVGGSAGDVSVSYTTSTLSATSSFASAVPCTSPPACAPGSADFFAVSGLLAFPRGVTRLILPIVLVDNVDYNGIRQFRITLSAPSGGVLLGDGRPSFPDGPAHPSCTGFISDEGEDVPGLIGFAAAEYVVQENAKWAFLEITRMRGSSGTVNITWSTAVIAEIGRAHV